MSVDQCSDQFVLALAARDEIVGVSPHALDTDAWLRREAHGLTIRRPTLEEALAARPDVVVSYWTADGRLSDALQAHGARVVRIEDAHDFDGVRANIRRVAAALGRGPEGEAMIVRMDAELTASRGAWGGRSALYLTPGGFSAGPDTLVGAIMAGAGLSDAVQAPGYGPISLERLTLDPPNLLVLGFFDDIAGQRWEPGRSPLVARLTKGRTAARRPGTRGSGCPAWFAADATASASRARAARAMKRIGLELLLIVILIAAIAAGVTLGEAQFVADAIRAGLCSSVVRARRGAVGDPRAARHRRERWSALRLGLSGALLQGLLRNPLDDPGVLGVSACAGAGRGRRHRRGFRARARRGVIAAALIGAVIGGGLLVAFLGAVSRA